MKYGRFNFYKNTFCIFRKVDSSPLAGLKPDHVSRSGSRYYFTDEGVYRFSNHWGRAAKCKWRLIASEENPVERKSAAGFARWEDFFPDNDHERLYWIRLSVDGTSAQYYHRSDPDYDGSFLRTASDTMKKIRKIRTILKSDKDAFSDISNLLKF